MVLVRILERKDASSLIVAIAAGVIVGHFLMDVSMKLGIVASGMRERLNFRVDIVRPVLACLFALVLLEGLARLTILVREQMVRRRP